MKKVLIITYYWPPASGPGVQRQLKFCKYLVKHGWQPIIVTVENGSFPMTDETLLEDVPNEIQVIRTKTLEPYGIYNKLRGKKGKSIEVGLVKGKNGGDWKSKLANYIRSNYFVPDARKGWNRYAYKAAARILKENNDIKAVVTSGPPHSSHLIGEKLKRKLQINWLADLRDPWTTIHYEAMLLRTDRSKAKNEAMEKLVLTSSDETVVVSDGMKDYFSDKYGVKNISVIPNGFDAEDLPSAQEKTPSETFDLCYVGNFKVNQNVNSLWIAIQELVEENPSFKKFFRLKVTGVLNAKIHESIQEYNLEDNLEVSPFVKHHEAVKLMFKANMLLLPIPDAENNKLILTGKIFEYLASQNPILGIGPVDGNAAQLLDTCQRDKMFDYSNKDGMKTFIAREFDYWLQNNNVSRSMNDATYLEYSRDNLTLKLIGLLNSLNN